MKKITNLLMAFSLTALASTQSIAATYEFRTPLNATTTFAQSEEKPEKPVERGPVDINGFCSVMLLVSSDRYMQNYIYYVPPQSYVSAAASFKNTKMATFGFNVDDCVRTLTANDPSNTTAHEFADKYARSDLQFLGQPITEDSVMEYGNRILLGNLVPLKPLNWENGASDKLHFRTKESLCNYYSKKYSSDDADTPFFNNACLNVKQLIIEPINIKDFKGMSAFGLSTSAITQKSNLWKFPTANFKLTETQLSFNITGTAGGEDETYLINAINKEVHSITVENQANGNIKACTSINAKAVKVGLWPAILVTCTGFVGEGIIAVPNSTTVFSMNK